MKKGLYGLSVQAFCINYRFFYMFLLANIIITVSGVHILMAANSEEKVNKSDLYY